MVTTGLCFLCLPQRQNYKATQCHSRALLAYTFIESQPLPFSHLSKQHLTGPWWNNLFFSTLSVLHSLVSGIKNLAFALKISLISSASLCPFGKFGTVRFWNTKTVSCNSSQTAPALHTSLGFDQPLTRGLMLKTSRLILPACKSELGCSWVARMTVCKLSHH